MTEPYSPSPRANAKAKRSPRRAAAMAEFTRRNVCARVAPSRPPLPRFPLRGPRGRVPRSHDEGQTDEGSAPAPRPAANTPPECRAARENDRARRSQHRGSSRQDRDGVVSANGRSTRRRRGVSAGTRSGQHPGHEQPRNTLAPRRRTTRQTSAVGGPRARVHTAAQNWSGLSDPALEKQGPQAG